ncbi:MAG: class I SAM-dependent rRNA methyltransferase [Proteobacteria bacterium]|nr:MAG: class I SAM-dependent rRNA methyltransferase [Pseudomonadota bacterium]
MSVPHRWLLKKGSEKKFKFGHPWVFSSELAQSPKLTEAGQLIELREFAGEALAIGYGHPNSMISFRTLTLDPKEKIDANFFVKRFTQAFRERKHAGVHEHSHRFIFAEGDYLPGLIIDRFFLRTAGSESTSAQVFVLQSSTAGMDKLLGFVVPALEDFVTKVDPTIAWEKTALVFANDSKSRAMEGIAVEQKRVVKSFEGFDPDKAVIVVQPAFESMKPVLFDVDFIGGQKTGFFLDQRSNVALAAKAVRELARDAAREGRTLRILDLFCYVGQWGTQLAAVATEAGAKVEVTLVDASMKALELAAANVTRAGGTPTILKLDILDQLGTAVEKETFDIVICDPPAFVKKKKDLPTGTQAYVKVNKEALRKAKPGGLFVSCSCSGLFDETEFRGMLSRVTAAYFRPIRWFARGSHGPDHPQRPEFPQGTYLKSWLGLID